MGKDEIQPGRGFLSNRCQGQWQIPADAQVTPETNAILDTTNAPASFISEINSPSHLETTPCSEFPYPDGNVTTVRVVAPDSFLPGSTTGIILGHSSLQQTPQKVPPAG